MSHLSDSGSVPAAPRGVLHNIGNTAALALGENVSDAETSNQKLRVLLAAVAESRHQVARRRSNEADARCSVVVSGDALLVAEDALRIAQKDAEAARLRLCVSCDDVVAALVQCSSFVENSMRSVAVQTQLSAQRMALVAGGSADDGDALVHGLSDVMLCTSSLAAAVGDEEVAIVSAVSAAESMARVGWYGLRTVVCDCVNRRLLHSNMVRLSFGDTVKQVRLAMVTMCSCPRPTESVPMEPASDDDLVSMEEFVDSVFN